jgi:hypothetical protein
VQRIFGDVQRIFGGVAALSGAPLLAFAVQEGTRPSGQWAIPVLIGVFVTSAVLWLLSTERAQAAMRGLLGKPSADVPTVALGTKASAVIGDGSGIVAGRDVNMGISRAETSRDERIRCVRREIKQVLKRLDQLDKRVKPPNGWNTVWPAKSDPYPPLPVGQWETHGDALALPTAGRDAIDRAYDLAEKFNDGLSAWLERDTFDRPPTEPDLAALRAAFVRADAVLAERRTDQS